MGKVPLEIWHTRYRARVVQVCRMAKRNAHTGHTRLPGSVEHLSNMKRCVGGKSQRLGTLRTACTPRVKARLKPGNLNCPSPGGRVVMHKASAHADSSGLQLVMESRHVPRAARPRLHLPGQGACMLV